MSAHSVLVNWLVEAISTRHYSDLVTGIVMPYTRTTENGKQYVFPGVTTGYGIPDCDTPEIFEVAPDSSRKSIIFFEDLTGGQVVKYEGGFVYFKASVRMVGWINLARLGLSGPEWGTKIMMDLLSSIPDGVINIPASHINAASIVVGSTLPRGRGIWQGYSVFRERKDYLNEALYDHFAVNLDLDWRMHKSCFANIPENPGTDCPPVTNKPTWCSITGLKLWAEIKACMSEPAIEAAIDDLCDNEPTTVNGVVSSTPTITVFRGGIPIGTLNPATGEVTVPECPVVDCDPATLRTTAGNVTIATIASGANYNLPETRLQYVKADGDFSQTLDGGFTGFVGGFIQPIFLIPRITVRTSDNSATVMYADVVDNVVQLPKMRVPFVQANGGVGTYWDAGHTLYDAGDDVLQAENTIPRIEILTSDGNTVVMYAEVINPQRWLPQTRIKFIDQNGDPTTTGAYSTDYSSGTLRPGVEVPRRELTRGGVPTGLFVTLERLISGTIPDVPNGSCPGATYQLIDSASNPIGSAGSISSGGSANIQAPDGSVQRKDSSGDDIGSPILVRSNQLLLAVICPDGLVQPRDASGNNIGSPVQVRSNGTAIATIPSSVITKPDGTTIDLLATVPLDVRAYQSGIVYNIGRVLWSGQSAVFSTGDEGSMYAAGFFNYTRPVYPTAYAELGASWTTLANNNMWGNTNRFTDRSGGQTYPLRIIQDHLTGIEYYVPVSPTASTFFVAISAATGLNYGGNTDWRIPPLNVLQSIVNNASNILLNYAPFNVTGVSVWSSTTTPGSTAAALPMNTAGAYQSTNKTTATPVQIYCRRFV